VERAFRYFHTHISYRDQSIPYSVIIHNPELGLKDTPESEKMVSQGDIACSAYLVLLWAELCV
jgi:hypothetical protein